MVRTFLYCLMNLAAYISLWNQYSVWHSACLSLTIKYNLRKFTCFFHALKTFFFAFLWCHSSVWSWRNLQRLRMSTWLNHAFSTYLVLTMSILSNTFNWKFLYFCWLLACALQVTNTFFILTSSMCCKQAVWMVVLVCLMWMNLRIWAKTCFLTNLSLIILPSTLCSFNYLHYLNM